MDPELFGHKGSTLSCVVSVLPGALGIVATISKYFPE
jgi:hypothetical protein